MVYKVKVYPSSLLLLVLIFFTSCGGQDDGLYTIDLRFPDYNEITLSEMADDITYTPLSNDSPIGTYYDTKVFRDHIIIPGQINGISLYDREGNYIRQIGSKGRGPGEYLYCRYIAVDYEGKEVYVMDSQQIKVFAFDGDFIRSFAITQHAGQHVSDSRGYENSFYDIYYFNNYLFISVYIALGMAYNDWVIIDTLGNMVSAKLNYIPSFESIIGWGGETYEYNNQINYHNHYNDTLFSISHDLSYKPSLLLNLGITIPETKESEQENLNKRFFIKILKVFETDNYWIMNCIQNPTPLISKQYYVIVDKETNEMFFMNAREPSTSNYGPRYTGGIMNDLDGGIPFQPERRFEENGREYMLELVSPFALKNYVYSDEFKNIVPKYSEKKEKLIKLADSLDEMDNLVLVTVRLK